MIAVLIIVGVITILYYAIRIMFMLFEIFEIPNPVIEIFNWIRGKLNNALARIP